jgi:hypothetical protein
LGKLNPHWKKALDTTISLVIEVGISSPFVSRHWRMACGGRRWSVTSLWISSSSIEEVLNITGCEAAMDEAEKIFGRREQELKWQ